MPEYVEVLSRELKSLTTPDTVEVPDLEIFNLVKIPAGNFPKGFNACESIYLFQLKYLLQANLDKEFAEQKEEIQQMVSDTVDDLTTSMVQNRDKIESLEETQNSNRIEFENKVNTETVRASEAEQNLNARINAFSLNNKAYLTYAAMDADKVNIPVNTKTQVVADPDTLKNKEYQWNGTVFTEVPNTVLSQANAYTDSKVSQNQLGVISALRVLDSSLVFKGFANSSTAIPSSPTVGDSYLSTVTGTVFGIFTEQNQVLTYNGTRWVIRDFVEVNARRMRDTVGGTSSLARKGDPIFGGYINATTGVLTTVSHTNGYVLSGYKPVKVGDILVYRSIGSSNAAAISYYDSNFNWVSGVAGVSNVLTDQTTVVPSGVAYARFSHNGTATALTEWTYSLKADSNLTTLKVLKEADITFRNSKNLATSNQLVLDKYVNSSGLIVTSGATGWAYYKIPVVAGKTYTFGNFNIDTVTYWSIMDSANNVLQYGTAGSSNVNKTVTIPEGGVLLNFDVKRPVNVEADYANTMVNEGSALLPYEKPVKFMTALKGYQLEASSGGSGGGTVTNAVLQGGNAQLADVTADSIIAATLIANLPTGTSEPAGVELGQAWVDTTTGTIKVKLV